MDGWFPMTKEPEQGILLRYLIPTPTGGWEQSYSPQLYWSILVQPSLEDLNHPNPCRSVPYARLEKKDAVAWRYA